MLPDIGGDPFVWLHPPYRREIHEATRLIGQKYIHQGSRYDLVDDYWKDWVKYDEIIKPDRLAISALINNVLNGKINCTGGRNCKRYDLVQGIDGLGVLAQCEHAVINGILGPPKRGSCRAEIAFWEDDVWVLAAIKAVPRSVGTCMRCIVCCSLQMGMGARFLALATEASFREKYKNFIVEAARQLKLGFQSTPWSFGAIYYNDGTNEFQGVSGRRRSNIIDGFEDLYLTVRPIVRSKNKDDVTSGFSVIEESFRKLSQDGDFVSPALGPKDDVSLDISIHLEVYVSKYNTGEDSYWIKPNSEQERRYKDTLSGLFSRAVEQACNKVGFRWESQTPLQPTCVEHSAQ